MHISSIRSRLVQPLLDVFCLLLVNLCISLPIPTWNSLLWKLEDRIDIRDNYPTESRPLCSAHLSYLMISRIVVTPIAGPREAAGDYSHLDQVAAMLLQL